MTEAEKEAMRFRLQQAVWTLRHMAMGPHGMPQQYRSWWPDVVHTRDEAYGWTSAKVTRQKPTAEQLSAMDQMLPLLYQLPVIDRQIVMLRALPLGWRKIAAELKCSHMTVKRWEEDAIERLIKIAANQ